jgi:hypothetical protein
VRRAKLGDRHYMVANSWSALAAAQVSSGEFAAAAEAYERARAIWVETDGPANPMALAALRNRCRALDGAGGGPEAAASWERLARELERGQGNPRLLAGYRVDLALHRLASRRPTLAESDASLALALLAAAGERAPATLARAQAARGRALLALARPGEARPLLEAALAGLEKGPPELAEELAATRRALGLEAEAPAGPGIHPGTLVHSGH